MDEKEPEAEAGEPRGMLRRFGPMDMQHYAGLYKLATDLEKSGCLPKGMNAGSAWVAMGAAFDLGISPIVGLSQITVINGRPRVSVELGLGLVRRSGLLAGEPTVEYIGDGKEDESGCRITIQRKGSPPRSETFTIRDARRAGLWGKEGPWSNFPRRMLRARPLGFLLHDNFSDVIAGLVFDEEASDETPPSHTPTGGPSGTVDPLLALPPADRPEGSSADVGSPGQVPTPGNDHAGDSSQAYEVEPVDRETPREAPRPSAPTPERAKAAPEAPRPTVPREAPAPSREAPAPGPATSAPQKPAPAQPAPRREAISGPLMDAPPPPPELVLTPPPDVERPKGPTPEQWKADAEAQVAKREKTRRETCDHAYARERSLASPGKLIVCSCGVEFTSQPVEAAVPPGEAGVAVAGKAGDLTDAERVKAALAAAKARAAERKKAAS